MPNALIHETSPYLLQHAHNPVAWLPWSEDAFAKAREENKLVFLSVGYSTCHWCHVMEHECFENDRIAEVMNHHFICIKVDREERPDIDSTYMAYVQASTGQGGWPMSVWLTPDGKPVFGGTYFPPDDRYGRPGFTRVCHELARLWRDDRNAMQSSAIKAMDHLRQQSEQAPRDPAMPDTQVFRDFLNRCESMFDPELGGFGGAPKFPRPVVIRALMQLCDRFGLDGRDGHSAWHMSEATLIAMANGGMHDHLGGGFHRYSVDRYWHVPHYEKMLYDQAQLAHAYLDGWQISGNSQFLDVANGIFRYLLETMRDPRGAFHAAEDADSLPEPDAKEKREGAFWTWTSSEIGKLLSPRDAAIFCAAFGVQADGNARPGSDPHGELAGQNTLFRATQDEELADMFDCTSQEIRTRLNDACASLEKARQRRPAPHRDDKIVTAWNGLAIGALARGARLTGRQDLADAANKAAAFIKQELWDGRRLFRSHRGHRGDAEGFPADYAFLISGLIELHAVSPDNKWLAWATELQQALDGNFWDAERSGYVMRPALGGETLMVIRDDYDGAEPSPNHLAAENLLKLATLLDEPAHAERAADLLRAGSHNLATHPYSTPLLLAALDLHDRGVMKFQVPPEASPATMEKLRHSYHPRAVHTHGTGNEVVVCEGNVCRIFASQ